MTSVWEILPGGRALVEWFGYIPRFHDAYLLEIELRSNGSTFLRTHTWEITDKVDDGGYLILDKQVVVTFMLDAVHEIALGDFNLIGIVGDLEITRTEAGFRLSWDSSYGVAGRIEAGQIHIDFKPGAPPEM